MAFVIGISGGSGCGKTTAIRMIQERLEGDDITIISQDDYYHPIERQVRDPKGVVNFDLPEAIDHFGLKNHIIALKEGREVEISQYTFNNPSAPAEIINLRPAPILLVEGLFVFHHVHIREHLDVKVFIDSPAHIRLERRLKRDLVERGYPEEEIRYQWENHVEPAFESFLMPHRDSCDMILDNTLELETQLDELEEMIKRRIGY